MKKVLGIVLTIVLAFSSVSVLATDNDGVIVNASDWAMEEVSEAYDMGLIPEALEDENLTENVTRAEFAAIAVMLLENLTGESVNVDYDRMPFDDIEKSLYHNEILTAYGLGITNGTSENTFSPDALITREQMATMLLRTLSVAEIDTDAESEVFFSDSDEISDYAKDAVTFMAENEIINGVGYNKFAPKATATREQAIAISLRCMKVLGGEGDTLGNMLKDEFLEIAEYGSAVEIAESLVTSPAVTELNLVAMEIEEGYLAGFDNTEITNFEEGAMFAPMIGAIPFVGYVFTLEDGADTAAFIENLESSANLRWNICTKADEMICVGKGNKVFFVMCPERLED